jgi:hypothetical protein
MIRNARVACALVLAWVSVACRPDSGPAARAEPAPQAVATPSIAAASPTATPSTSASAAVAAPGAPSADLVVWQLGADPGTTLPMSARGGFALSIVARNDGPRAVDTRRDRLAFLVNGRPSMMLSMAFGNGARERRWSALAPGDTVREARGTSADPSFGAALFPAPGDYAIAIEQDGRPVAHVQVRISP